MLNPKNAIALVSTPTQVLATADADAIGRLAPYEQARANALRTPIGRDAYIAAHLLVRRAAALFTRRAQEELVLQQRCPDCGGPHGPPSLVGLPNVHVSLSHGDGVVAAIAGPSPVAIDVEEWRKVRVDQLLDARVFSRNEAEALCLMQPADQTPATASLWVHKECMVKLGRLTLDQLADCDFSDVVKRRQQGQYGGIAHGDLVFSEWRDATLGMTAAAASAQEVRWQVSMAT